MLDLYLLITLIASALIYAPIYFRIRKGMTLDSKNELPITYFTRKRIFRFTLAILVSLISCLTISTLFIIAIKSRGDIKIWTSNELIELVLFGITWIGIAFGAGLYVSGVFIEQYSMNNIKHNPEYSRIKVATKLLHGRISHLLIYSGGMFGFFLLALFELSNPLKVFPREVLFIYIFTGIVFGGIYYRSQIINLTWRFQLPFFILFFILGFLIYISQSNFLDYPYFLFYVFFSGTAALGLMMRRLRKGKRKRRRHHKQK